MEVQLDRICAHPEGCRRLDPNALYDGDRYGARWMRDREPQYRAVRDDDGDRIPRRGPGRSIRDRARHQTGGFGLTIRGPGAVSNATHLTIDPRRSIHGASPKPSPAPHIGRIARRAAREISDGAVAPLFLQREHGALRVRASGDPAPARNFKGTLEDVAATGLHARRGGVDVTHIEVEKPERGRDHGRLGEHAADRLPCGGE